MYFKTIYKSQIGNITLACDNKENETKIKLLQHEGVNMEGLFIPKYNTAPQGKIIIYNNQQMNIFEDKIEMSKITK